MIIQCRKCETRFRFDDRLMEGDGVWVRCSRCQYVFFQEKPAGAFVASEPEIPSVRISDAKRGPEDRFTAAEKGPVRSEIKTEGLPHSKTENGPLADVETGKEPSLGVLEENLDGNGDEDRGTESPDGSDDLTEEEAGAEGEEARPRKRWGRALLKGIALIVFVGIVAGAVSLYVWPEVRTRVSAWISPWVQGVPLLEDLIGADEQRDKTALAPVRIRDVRQRSVANLLMGNLRVIEGVAVNQSAYPLARIRVRLVVSDAYDVVLAEKNVFCGNLLTDAELAAMAENEIQKELSIPEGSDVSNGRIAPNGEIPFMIVFSQEQAGAVKTTVMPSGADRLP